MSLQLIRATFAQNGSITPCLRIIQDHGLLKEIKPIHLVNGASGRFDAVINNKRLTLGLQVGLCDDLEDISKLRKNLFQSHLQLINLDSLVYVPNLIHREQ